MELEPGRHAMDGAVRMVAAEALFPITGIVTAAYLTRALGPANYGLFTLSATVFAFLEFIVLVSLSRATVRLSADPANWVPAGTRIIQVHVLIGAVTGLALYLLSPWLSRVLDDESLLGYLRLFAVLFPFAIAAGAHRNLMTGRGEYRWRAICRVAYLLSRMALIILFVQLGWSVPGAILGMMAASLIELVLSRARVRPKFWARSDFPVFLLLGYAAPLAFRSLCLRLIRSDLILLKALGGDAVDVGIYGGAQNLSLVPGLLATGISGLLLSTLVRTKAVGDTEGSLRISRNFERMIIGLLPFATMTAGMNREIMGLFFGPDYVEGGPILALLIFAGVGMMMLSMCTSMLVAEDRPGLTWAILLPIVPLAIVGHIVVIPLYGAQGAAAVTAVVTGLATLAGLAAAAVVCGVLPPMRSSLRSGAICVVIYFVCRWLDVGGLGIGGEQHALVKLLVAVKLMGISAGIVAAYVMLGEFTREELRFFRSLLPPRFRAG